MDRVLRERILSRIIINEQGCWVWQGYTLEGYGRIRIKNKVPLIHRVTYEEWRGPIPGGLDLDHICHPSDGSCREIPCPHRRCANPYHVEPSTKQQNTLRGNSRLVHRERFERLTHCKYGHEFTLENTYRPPKRPHQRHCKECNRISNRAIENKKKNKNLLQIK